jgi:hypothetical protein
VCGCGPLPRFNVIFNKNALVPGGTFTQYLKKALGNGSFVGDEDREFLVSVSQYRFKNRCLRPFLPGIEGPFSEYSFCPTGQVDHFPLLS